MEPRPIAQTNHAARTPQVGEIAPARRSSPGLARESRGLGEPFGTPACTKEGRGLARSHASEYQHIFEARYGFIRAESVLLR